MSLQNLLKPNNYELYCDTLNVNNFGLDTIETNKILPIGTGTSINIFDPNASPCTLTVNGNITLPSALNGIRRIGTSGAGYSELWCNQLQGLGAPVQVQNGIVGNNGTQPLYVANYGLTFNNAVPAPPVTSYTLDNYVEYNGTLDLNGYTTTIVASYSATIIGKQVTISLSAPVGLTQIAGGYIQSDPLPPEFKPPNVQYFTYTGQAAGNNFTAIGWIDTTGVLNFTADIQLNTFAGSVNVGLDLAGPVPPGARIVIQYLLN